MKTEAIPLRAVRTFVALGRCGSVTQAAAELGVSPSAVTQQIHLLEKYLAVRLIERSGRGIALTSWGTMYLPYAAGAIDRLLQGEHDLRRAQQSEHLVLSAFPSIVNRWLGPLLFQWKKQHPTSTVFLKDSDEEPRLDENEADFRISYGARCRHHQRYRQLFTDFLLPVASPAFLAAQSPLKKPSDILRLPLLWVDWGPEYVAVPSWRDWFAAFGVPREEVPCNLTYSLSSAALDAAMQGHGLVLAQYSMVATALKEKALVRVFERCIPLPEPYFLAWSGTTLDKPHGTAMQAWLTEEARRFDWQIQQPLLAQNHA